MLGYNLFLLGFIFDCILTLVPFPSCFKAEILILTFSQLGKVILSTFNWDLGVFGPKKIENYLNFEIYMGHVLVMV